MLSNEDVQSIIDNLSSYNAGPPSGAKTAILYSGSDESSKSYQKAEDCTENDPSYYTIEQTQLGSKIFPYIRNLLSQNQITETQYKQIADAASSLYVKAIPAGVRVIAIVNNVSSSSTFVTAEIPALAENANITSVNDVPKSSIFANGSPVSGSGISAPVDTTALTQFIQGFGSSENCWDPPGPPTNGSAAIAGGGAHMMMPYIGPKDDSQSGGGTVVIVPITPDEPQITSSSSQTLGLSSSQVLDVLIAAGLIVAVGVSLPADAVVAAAAAAITGLIALGTSVSAEAAEIQQPGARLLTGIRASCSR